MAEFSLSMRPVILLLLYSFTLAQDPSLVGVPGCGQRPMDLVILLDSSGSYGDFQAMQQFAAGVVSLARVGDDALRVGLVSFGEDINGREDLARSTSSLEVQQAIMSTRHRPGGRDISQALMTLTEMFKPQYGDRPDAPNVALLLTTGPSTANSDLVKEEAYRARSAGISIFVVAFGIKDETEIDQIVGEPVDESKYVLDGPATLPLIEDVVLGEMCSRLDQLQSQRIRQSSVMDLVFLMHFSRSLDRKDFQAMMDFVRETLAAANIDSGDVRVGLAVYRKRGLVNFHLNQYSTKADVLKAIDDVSYSLKAGQANAASGIDVVREEMFTAKTGDRPDAPNVVVIVTDENANDDVARLITSSQELRQAGAYIYSVGVGLDNPQELQATASNGNYFPLASFDQLTTAREVIAEQLASLSIGPGATSGLTVHATRGPETLGPDVSQQFAAAQRADIVFAVHFDRDGNAQDFDRLKSFISDLVRSSDVDSGNVRFGLAFSGPYAAFQLTSRLTTNDVLAEISRVGQNVARRRRFDATGLLESVRTSMFTPQNGDRPDAPNGIILITDTPSNQSPQQLQQEAAAARAAGITVYAMGVGLQDKGELENLASSPRNIFTVSNFQELQRADNVIKQEISALRTGSVARDRPTTPRTGPRSEVAIIVDTTNPEKLDSYRSFVKDFVGNPGVAAGTLKVAVVEAGGEKAGVKLSFLDVQNSPNVDVAIDTIPTSDGRPDVAGAMTVIQEEVFNAPVDEGQEVKRAVIALYGIARSRDPGSSIQKGATLRNEGVEVFTVGLNLRDDQELVRVSSQPSENYVFSVNSPEDLSRARSTIAGVLAPADPLSGRPKRKNDIVIALDATVHPTVFEWMKSFAKDFTSGLEVTSGLDRVAVITFDSDADIDLDLKRRSKNDLDRGIESLETRRSYVDNGRALNAITDKVLNGRGGDREDAPNTVVFVSGTEVSRDPAGTAAAADRLKATGANVFAVGINVRGSNELDEIASGPTETHRFLVRGQEDLARLKTTLLEEIGKGQRA